jgi:hypothetical protein
MTAPNLSLAHVAKALNGEISGDSVLAPGPGHSAKDRSLSIKFDNGAPGGFVVHSFAGDDAIACKDYVREKLGLAPWKVDGAGPRVVATYIYHTEQGEPYLKVLRTRDKSFAQFRRDGTGWERGAPKGPKIPYRLPELLNADAAFIVEGEKDADNVTNVGLVATTNSGGADAGKGSKWTPDLNKWFAGKAVYVLPDNDAAGAKHAQTVACNLHGVAREVRIVELPRLPPKGDVSDWIAAGGTAEELKRLAEAAPPWVPVTSGQPPARDLQSDVVISIDDFRAYMPMHNYIFIPSLETWPASSVNARLGKVSILGASDRELDDDDAPKEIPANAWLDKNRPVEQMTWAPGLPMLIRDRLVSNGGWIERSGMTCFNLYRPPAIVIGDAAEAEPWLDLVKKVFPDDADHIVKWLAHRVQRPEEKINHAILLGGEQGIGKDTILEPVKRAVGPWNFSEASPHQVLGRFNGFLKSVVLRVSETRDLGDVNRFQFYEHMKTYTAAPPDVLRVDEKNLREYTVFNCCGVIFTTNRRDSFYIPADDRRTYVAWSDLKKEDFNEGYWTEIWRWYTEGGDRHIAAYLMSLDISTFNPKAPPPKTPTFWQIVEINSAPEDSELADVLDKIGNPKALTLAMIASAAGGESGDGNFVRWLTDRKNARAIPHRMEKCGYVSIRNEKRKGGTWLVGKTRKVIYVRAELSTRERHMAAEELVAAGSTKADSEPEIPF